jgi:PhnB protein
MPAIAFEGNCDEAITYYKETFGAEVKVINYGSEAPKDYTIDNPLPDKYVMYSEVRLFGATMVMTDGGKKPLSESDFWMQVSFDTKEAVIDIFEKLANDGKVIEAPTPQFWASLNAYVIDRFGVFWNILTNEQVS